MTRLIVDDADEEFRVRKSKYLVLILSSLSPLLVTLSNRAARAVEVTGEFEPSHVPLSQFNYKSINVL